MAKTAVKPMPEKNLPATTKPKEPTAVAVVVEVPNFLDKYKEDAGKGYSHKAEDAVVPFVSILQDLSPQLKGPVRGGQPHEKFIPGAEKGDILVKGMQPPIVKGEDGIIVQPCAFQRRWVEWVPRLKGGGFVAAHEMKPEDVVEKPNPEDPTRMKLYRKNGNEILDTRYHFVLWNGQPYVIPFTSTGHTVSREWTQLIKTVGGGRAAFARKYKLTTKLKTKGDNEWFVFAVEDKGWVTSEEEYLRGQALEASIASGEKVADVPEDDARTEDSGASEI